MKSRRRLGDGSVDVVAYASTTTGYVLGVRCDTTLVKRLANQCGVPVVCSAGAAADALRACDADRLVVIHPPWFDKEIDRIGVGYLRDQGLDVTLLKATGLPRDPEELTQRASSTGSANTWVTVTKPCSWLETAFEPPAP